MNRVPSPTGETAADTIGSWNDVPVGATITSWGKTFLAIEQYLISVKDKYEPELCTLTVSSWDECWLEEWVFLAVRDVDVTPLTIGQCLISTTASKERIQNYVH